MTGTILDAHVMHGVQAALNVVAARSLPVVIVLCAAGECPLAHAAVAVVTYTLIAVLATVATNFSPAGILVTYALLAGGSAIPYLSRRFLPPAAVVALALGLFVVAPGLIAPRNASGTLLLFGWEVALSVSSYCIENAENEGSWTEYLFFVLVNPCLVWNRRGKLVDRPGLHPTGMWRIGEGFLRMTLAGAIASFAAYWGDYFYVNGVVGLLRIYLAGMGLGALQVGLLRQAGYVIPERYENVIAATSPADFWRRWNTYVGHWARTYVYRPISLFIVRRTPPASRRSFLRRAVPLVSAFFVVGALHDLYSSFSGHAIRFFSAPWFVGNAVLVVAWEAAARRLRRTGYSPRTIYKQCGVLSFALLFATMYVNGTSIEQLLRAGLVERSAPRPAAGAHR
jgi:hypothetical protein